MRTAEKTVQPCLMIAKKIEKDVYLFYGIIRRIGRRKKL